MALLPGGGPFECDIEKSLMGDFALSGELIHSRWFSLLLKRKPDTKNGIIKIQDGGSTCVGRCVS